MASLTNPLSARLGEGHTKEHLIIGIKQPSKGARTTMVGKLWRSRGRFMLSNLILFGLGAMTCLICLQVFATSGINDPIVYTNPEEYKLALQLKQAPPLQQTDSNSYVYGVDNNNNQNNKDDHQKSSLLCGSAINGKIGSAVQSATAKQVIDLNISNKKANSNTNTRIRNGDNKALTSATNPNAKNDILKSSNLQELSHSKNRNEFGSQQQDDLKNFEGISFPPDNNLNNDILNSKDLLLQEENADGEIPFGPTVWVVTPTFYRPEQKPELTRVAQALLPVSDFVHWIVVEDTSKRTDTSFESLKKFLQRFPLAVTVLESLPPKSRIVGKPRGVGGRTAAIKWLRENAQEGVVYFADDDNTYDSDIFKQMRATEKVTMWPVGLVTELGVSSPIVRNGRVVGFYDGWNGQRKFPVDMAGFAINLQLFLDKPKASMPWKAGYEEDELLQSLGITMKDIKPLAKNCTEILVWHTKAVKNVWPKRAKNLKPSIASETNLHTLLQQLPQKSPVSPVETHPNNADNGFSLLRILFGKSL